MAADPSMTRVAAGAFGFLILSHAFDGPDLYGALSFFETMPSRPSLQTALNIFYAGAFGVFDVLNAASSLPMRSLKMIAPSGGIQVARWVTRLDSFPQIDAARTLQCRHKVAQLQQVRRSWPPSPIRRPLRAKYFKLVASI
jgi:hypothetical protein